MRAASPPAVALRRIVGGIALCLVAIACVPGAGKPQGLRLTAVFDSTHALYEGSSVRVLGVDVGHVTDVTARGDEVLVSMVVTADQPIPADVGAALTPVSLLGERIVTLAPPYTGGPEFEDGGTIPKERTATPAEIDEVLRSFQQFAEALDERTLAELIDVASETFEGQGPGLNQLIDQGADTVEVLDHASADLNAMVDEIGRLNATLATRDHKIGRTLERLSVVLQTFAEEKDDIIGSIAELRRLTNELRPLVDEHTGPLITDLESLTTALSTVDRNLDRVEDTYAGTHRLFKYLQPLAADYENGQAKLNNKGEALVAAVELRTIQRLAGVCIRLEVEACSDAAFWAEHLGEVTCISTQSCPDPGRSLADALADALGAMPAEAKVALRREARQQQRQGTEREQPEATRPRRAPDAADDGPLDVPTPEPTQAPLLPLPDPRLQTLTTLD